MYGVMAAYLDRCSEWWGGGGEDPYLDRCRERWGRVLPGQEQGSVGERILPGQM